MPTCLAPNDPARVYNYCPALAPAILFAILFSSVTVAHVVQAFLHRHPAAWVLIMAGLWEIGGYVSRTISIYNQADSGIYTTQFLLILLAPLWINAYVYMILGRMMHFFLANDRVFGIRARKITLVFVLFDITAFIVQLSGGLMTSGTDIPVATVKLGLNIYTGGVALQLAFIFIFICLSIRFRKTLKRQNLDTRGQMKRLAQASSESLESQAFIALESQQELPLDRDYFHARSLLRTLWVALSLIIARNTFRLIEYAMGGVNGNAITRHEWFQYVFDATLMFLAMVVLSVYHPGKVLQGERSDFTEENRMRKAQKKARKQDKINAKKAKKSQESSSGED